MVVWLAVPVVNSNRTANLAAKRQLSRRSIVNGLVKIVTRPLDDALRLPDASPTGKLKRAGKVVAVARTKPKDA